ncbi:hypothetical protein BDY19DRAFT_613233 [Irpex rosettiformis]|uniref:Uncharacterized protein n=1 Tax=Irpex rosettiformis TaxID=378272 RepID=A0ACB8TP92_9APHY|nr:hypothetical protein BDY19DRAFT_613233 [Irpex rosettiformis]
MAVGDLLHFDEAAYINKIARPWYPDEVLYDNIHRKRRQTASSGFAIGAGVALAPVTAGVSLASSAYGARTLDIAKRKLGLLEWEWGRRGYAPLPEHFMRDRVLPMAVTGVVSAATLGFDMGLGAAGANVAAQAGVHGMGQVLHGAGHGIAANGIVPQITAGLEKGVEEATHYAMSGAAFHTHGFYNPPPPYQAIGEAAGVEAVKEGIRYGAGRAGLAGQEYVAKRWY